MEKSDFKNAADNIVLIISTMFDAFDELLGKPNIKESLNGTGVFGLGRSKLSKIVNVSKNLGKVISSIAKGVKDMAELNVPVYGDDGKITSYRKLTETDFTDAATNTSKCITIMMEGLASAAENPDIKEAMKGRGSSRMEKILELANNMGGAIGGIAKGVIEMAKGVFVDENKKTQKIGEPEYTAAATNTSTLITTIIRSLADLSGDDEISKLLKGGGWLGKGDSLAQKVFGIGKDIGSMLTPLAENVVSLANNDYKDANGKIIHLDSTQIANAGINVGELMKSIINGLNDEDLLKGAEKIKDNFKKADIANIVSSVIDPVVKIKEEHTKNFDSIVESTGNLITHVGKVDLGKITKVNDLIGNIAKLSESIKGNFDTLGEIVGEKLLKAIEELNEALDKMQNININTSSTTTIAEPSNTPKSATTMTGEVISQPGKSPDISGIISSIQNISNSINELIDDGIRINNTSPIVVTGDY